MHLGFFHWTNRTFHKTPLASKALAIIPAITPGFTFIANSRDGRCLRFVFEGLGF
jgi:hypothetical protein